MGNFGDFFYAMILFFEMGMAIKIVEYYMLENMKCQG